MNRLTLFGTKHHEASKAPPYMQGAIDLLIDKFKPDVILEEWSSTRPQSLADAVAKSRGIPWEDIGTPSTDEFETYNETYALDFPMGPANLRRHGPLDVQEKREAAMCKNIQTAMSTRNASLIVIGVAHLHSMFMKLSKDFEVKAYAFADEFY